MKAIKDNLIIEAWKYYKQGDPTPGLIDAAGKSLGNIKRTNIKMSPSRYDSALQSKAGGGGYNIYTDSATGRGGG